MLVEGVLAAPLLWAGVPPVLVHNFMLLGAIVASGVGNFVLARHLTGSVGGALAAGVIFAFAPYRFEHYMHMELQWTVWSPWAFWALQRTLETASIRFGLLTGLFLALHGDELPDVAVHVVQAEGVRLETADGGRQDGPGGLAFRIGEVADLLQALAESSPEENRVVVPARQAYSHSASVGSRYFLPSFLLSQAQKAAASFQLTLTTGCRSVCSFHQVSQVNSGLRAKVVPGPAAAAHAVLLGVGAIAGRLARTRETRRR